MNTSEFSDSDRPVFSQNPAPSSPVPTRCTRRLLLDSCHRLVPTEEMGPATWDIPGPDGFLAGLPDEVYLHLPSVLREDAALAFACDFRQIGGPFRSLTIQFK